MDLVKIVTELRAELARLDSAIVALERLALARGKRRGRPSKAMLEAQSAVSASAAAAPRFRKTLVKRKKTRPE